MVMYQLSLPPNFREQLLENFFKMLTHEYHTQAEREAIEEAFALRLLSQHDPELYHQMLIKECYGVLVGLPGALDEEQLSQLSQSDPGEAYEEYHLLLLFAKSFASILTMLTSVPMFDPDYVKEYGPQLKVVERFPPEQSGGN